MLLIDRQSDGDAVNISAHKQESGIPAVGTFYGRQRHGVVGVEELGR